MPISKKIYDPKVNNSSASLTLNNQTSIVLEQYINQVAGWLKMDKTEKEWQKLLLKIFPIIFPQYIAFLREQHIPITQNSQRRNDIPDYLALKDTFSLDIIEIKKPLYQVLRNGLYRGKLCIRPGITGTNYVGPKIFI